MKQIITINTYKRKQEIFTGNEDEDNEYDNIENGG